MVFDVVVDFEVIVVGEEFVCGCGWVVVVVVWFVVEY